MGPGTRAEPEAHLAEHEVVEHLDPAQLADTLAQLTRSECQIGHGAVNPAAAEGPQRGPDRHTAGGPGELGDFLEGMPRAELAQDPSM